MATSDESKIPDNAALMTCSGTYPDPLKIRCPKSSEVDNMVINNQINSQYIYRQILNIFKNMVINDIQIHCNTIY